MDKETKDYVFSIEVYICIFYIPMRSDLIYQLLNSPNILMVLEITDYVLVRA